MSTAWDVAIIGGGPAGSASAISLRQTFPSLSVLMLESSDYSRARAGEVLPPIARDLLTHLGVLEEMSESVATPARGLACAWGAGDLDETNYFYGLAGEGWHLDRRRFDAMLATRAEALGVTVCRNTSLHSSSRNGDVWQLQAGRGDGDQCDPIEARFVIDATGRNATFARSQGAQLQPRDALMAFSRIFQHDGPVEARMIVEACTHGWWYTAPLPGHRRVVSLLTDADLGRHLRLHSEPLWQEQLRTTSHVRHLVDGARLQPGVIVRSAATAALDRVCGEGWLAAGDAATAFDPLSAQGITSALRSGILASFAAGDVVSGRDVSAQDRYQRIVSAHGSNYDRVHREHYSRERRWSNSPFWQRRQSAAPSASTADLAPELCLQGAV